MRTPLKPILALLVLVATAFGNASAEPLADFVPSKLRMDGVPSFKAHWSRGGVGFAAPSLVSLTTDPVVSGPTDRDSVKTEPTSPDSPSDTADGPLVRAMWVWGAEAVVDPARRSQLLKTDIPVWYDVHDVSRNGEVRPLHELVIDVTDGLGLMDYRDTAERIIADAAQELQYASATNKQVVVGVETLCIEPTWITFCEEGSAFMEQLLDQIDLDLKQYSSYRGQAIHHFDFYWKMML